MLKTFRQACRFLWREWRAGEWIIVFFALFFAVAAITALHFYTDRLMRGLEQQSSKLLGGDLVISSASAIPDAWNEKAISLHLRTATVWTFPSMIDANNKLQLVNIQAVSDHYPLLGNPNLRPTPHNIWLDPRLLPLLSIKIGDSVLVGADKLRSTNSLTSDIDTLNTGFSIAPRLMMRLEDVPATRTVLPGSRVDYRLLIVGDKKSLTEFMQWLTPQLHAGQRLLNIRDQQFLLRDVIQRTESYLQLALVICLLMSGVAISISIQQYLRRHYSHVALWRCLGANGKDIVRIFFWQLLIIALMAGALGTAVGFLVQLEIADLFKDMLRLPLPSASFTPALLGFVSSSLILFVFAYPIILELPNISPLFIWRNEVASHTKHSQMYFALSLIILLGFVYALMGISLLTLLILNIILLSIGFLYALSILLLSGIRAILDYTNGTLRRGLSQLTHHPESVSIQLIGFTIILTSLIVLSHVRTNILDNWQQTLPQNTPNYFAFNIAPTDITQLKTLFQTKHIPLQAIYPITRGRLISINQQPVLSVVPETAKSNNALNRELNLSWMSIFPSDNKIVQGGPWLTKIGQKPLVSIEEKLATDLHLHIGDELTFQIGESQVSAFITNIRKVEWTSFHPNFYIIFQPGLLETFPTTYLSSFYLAPDKTGVLNDVSQTFPNITVIDIANILHQIQTLINKIGLAIQYLFLFTLAAGILIFVTSLQASMDERRQTYRLLRILGASQKYIYQSVAVEFISLALLVSVISFSLARLMTYLLMKNLF
jgi:putative ABC transport system permease protein